MPQPQVIAGSAAFSGFRSRALASQIGAEDVQGQYQHYIDLHKDLSGDDWTLLERLLTDGHVEKPSVPSNDSQVF